MIKGSTLNSKMLSETYYTKPEIKTKKEICTSEKC